MKTIAILALLTAALAASVLRTAERHEAPPSSRHFAGLGDLPGGICFSAARAVSADGTVVVGYANSAAGMQAFRWTQGGGMERLAFLLASGVSADGKRVTGYRHIAGRCELVQWTAHDGLERRNEHHGRGEAHAISADGDVVVGARRNAAGHSEAFRWMSQSGAVALGFLPGHSTSTACGVSADGTVIVGFSSDYLTTDPFRWTKKSGMVPLGKMLGGGRNSAALGVSADGAVIVGYCGSETGWEAFVWDAAHGMRSLRQVLLRDYHLSDALRGWKLSVATGVSADGSVVVGFGRNPAGEPEAWIARLAADSAVARISFDRLISN